MHLVLCGKAGVAQESALGLPFGDASVIEEFEFFGDDEGRDVVPEAFLEEKEPADSAVAVLKGVDFFKAHMKVEDVVERDGFFRVVFGEELLHPYGNFGRLCGFGSAHFVFEHLVAACLEPGFSAVARARLEDKMQLLDETFRQARVGGVNHEVNAAEMVHRLDDVVNPHVFPRRAERCRLKDEARLFMRKA